MYHILATVLPSRMDFTSKDVASHTPHTTAFCSLPMMITPMTSLNAQTPLPSRQRYHTSGYNDYADVHLDMELETLTNLMLATPLQLAQRCRTSDLVFPQKLHMMLTASEQDTLLQR